MADDKWRLLRSPRFDKMAAAFPLNILDKLEQVLKKLEEDPFDSQLQIKKLKAKSGGVYACRLGRVDGEHRRIRLRNVGSRQNFYDDA
jgi:mRNA-degrading endonuclease RelE of RelBE toxin-antitoxin system